MNNLSSDFAKTYIHRIKINIFKYIIYLKYNYEHQFVKYIFANNNFLAEGKQS